jgi:superfamily I DNA/RNA helicase
MAWQLFGRDRYAGRLAAGEGAALHAYTRYIESAGAIAHFRQNDRAQAARAITETLKRFMASSRPAIVADLVPENAELDAETVAAAASVLWEAIEEVTTLPVLHDFYLKRWQLQRQPIPWAEVVLYDEAQDATPAMLAAVEHTPGLQRVYVGDPHQQIYDFRGAVNALDSLSSLPVLSLTKTWRFGAEIAAAANAILEAKRERRRIVPLGNAAGRTALGYPPSAAQLVLARTNVGLVEQALGLIDDGAAFFIRGATDPKTGVAGSGAGELMGRILGAFDLWQGQSARHDAFTMFTSWDDLKTASESDGGEAHRPYVRIVEAHRRNVPRIIKQLKDHALKDEARADVVLSTVHRFKGEERASVTLAGDFKSFAYFTRETKGMVFDESEANIAYVAMTRARTELWMGGAYETLARSARLCGASIPITSAPVADLPVTAMPARDFAPLRPRAVSTPRRSYAGLSPGDRCTHPAYGTVTIEDATSQLITITTEAGETKTLATQLAAAKLTRA